MSVRGVCDRCGTTAALYPISEVDEDTGELREGKACWDCDWDITNNRGSLTDDSGEVLNDRWDNEYEYDPINTPVPPWRAEAR